jgi:TolA-binding protein
MRKSLILSCLFCSNIALCSDSDNSISARIVEVESIVRNVNGSHEKLKHRITTLEKANTDLNKTIEDLKKELSALKSDMEAIKDAANDEPEEVVEKLTGKQAVQKADEFIKTKNYDAAIRVLSDFLANNDKDIYRGQAYFFLGAAYQAKNMYKQATESYLRAQKENPDGAKAAHALFGAGMCMLKQKDKKKAQIVFNKLKTSYADKHDLIDKFAKALEPQKITKVENPGIKKVVKPEVKSAPVVKTPKPKPVEAVTLKEVTQQ